jgi:hypothetical protein
MSISVYLAGKVAKGSEIGTIADWRALLTKSLTARGFEVLSPDDPTLDERRPMTVFGHDCLLIQQASLVVVDASTKLGVGTAQEMVIAKHFAKPVVTILPPQSHHRRSNLEMHGYAVDDWMHPFLVAMSDLIVDSEEQLLKVIDDGELGTATKTPKTLTVIDDGIAAYKAAKSRP